MVHRYVILGAQGVCVCPIYTRSFGYEGSDNIISSCDMYYATLLDSP